LFAKILLTLFTFHQIYAPKKASHPVLLKKLRKYVCEIDSWAEFHQHSTYSFHTRGAQKRKKDSQVVSLFTLLGSTRVKAEGKYVGEIDSWFLSLSNIPLKS
jgi:hypothetical protein